MARTSSLTGGDAHNGNLKEIIHAVTAQCNAALKQAEADEDMAPEKRMALVTSAADALAKAVRAAGRLAPELSRYAVAMEVVQGLSNHTATHHPEHAQTLLELLESYAPKLEAACNV